MPRLVGKREVVTGWLYDAGQLVGGTVVSEMPLFVSPRGSPGFGIATKTFVHTNMESGSGFLAGVKAFIIKSILLKVRDCAPPVLPDIQPPPPPWLINNASAKCAVLNEGFGTIRIGDLGKPYPSPFPLWMSAGGPQLNDNARGSFAVPPAVRGQVGPGYIGNVMRWADMLPIAINTLEVFEVTLNWPGGIDIALFPDPGVAVDPPTIQIWFVLYGFLKRQVA